MSEILLPNFMRVTYEITKAERAFAVDTSLNVLATINLQPEIIDSSYLRCIKKALEEDKAIITDSITLTIDPSQAPKTNRSFPQLRAVFVIPVKHQGAVCLDHLMGRGEIISKEQVDRLMKLGQQISQSQHEGLMEDQMLRLYKQMV